MYKDYACKESGINVRGFNYTKKPLADARGFLFVAI
jgi:hypothetical protein